MMDAAPTINIQTRNKKLAVFSDYLTLTKPRTILLHLITAGSAMFLAAGGHPPAARFAFTIIGGSLVAAASNALNCYFDRDLDGLMSRTRQRPLPSGRLAPGRALLFGTALGIAGGYLLMRFVNLQVAALALLACLFYVLVYTVWLKRRTYWSAIIGSAAGAFPPLIGWIAISQELTLVPFVLAAIIVLWTPVHFWSLAVTYHRDYDTAGVMASPERHASGWITVFSILLVCVSFLLIPVARLGLFYMVLASLLGLGLIYLAVRLQIQSSRQVARLLFLFSICYLVGLFFAMALGLFI